MHNEIRRRGSIISKLLGITIIAFTIAVLSLAASAVANSDSSSTDTAIGDLNGDGQVNIIDLTLLKLILLGQEPPIDNADVDGNGIINTLDIDALLDQIFSKVYMPHRSGGGGGGGGATVTNQVNFELSTYMSSYGPGATGHTFNARVRISQTSFLYNGSFTVDYNSSILQVNDVGSGLIGTCTINMVNGIDWVDTPGQLSVFPNLSACAVNGTGVSGNGYFCNISFETKGVGTSPLVLGNGTLYQSQAGNISIINGSTWINSSAQVSQLYSLNTSSTDHGNVTTPGETGPYTYSAGQIVNIAATPDACYHFVNWTGDTSTIADINDSTTTITMNADYTITANFAIDTYALSVAANPGAGGVPYFDGSSPFDCGTNATIHANTSSCYTFVNWTPTEGVANSSAENTTVYMNKSRSLTANYAVKSVTLSTSSTTGGNVSTPGESGPYTYNCGQVVTINATPDTCYSFVNWTGTGVDAGKVANPNAASTTITTDANYSVQANFVISSTPTLTLAADPAEGGTPTGAGTFNCGVSAPIQANMNTCYDFVNWTPADGIANPSAANTTVSMTTNRSLTAHYTIKRFTLSVSASPAAGGNPTGAGTYNCSQNASIAANPTSCYSFVNWTGSGVTAGKVADPNAASTTITMDASYSVQANFVINTYTLSLNASPTAGGNPTGAGTFNCGTIASISANPTSCYDFVNWTPADGVTNANAASTTVYINQSRSITANYVIKTFSLSVTANNSGGSPYFDGSSPFNCNSLVNIYANNSSCYTFAGWTPTAGVTSPGSANTTVNMSQARALTASYSIKRFTLSTSSSSGGNVTTPGEPGPYTYNCGQVVPINATPDTCYIFSNWTGTGVDAGKVANPNAASTTITMDANYSAQANFVISSTFALTLVADPTAGGNPYFDGSSPFNCGTIVNIHANTDPCYTFVNWTGSPSIASPSSANTTVQMNSAYTLTAHYSIRTYSLTTNVLPSAAYTEGCRVTGAGTYNCGANATIQANPAGRYSFDYWTSTDPAINGSTSNPTSVIMSSAKSVTANFVIHPNTVYFQSIGNQTVGNNFSIQVLIYNTSYLTYGTFDIRYNSSILSFVGLANTSSAIGDGTGSATPNVKSAELFTVDIDYSSYANSHSGNGVNGSGYLCTLTFSPIASGASPLYFVSGEGTPPGELSLLKWIAYEESSITPVYWKNSSVTVQ